MKKLAILLITTFAIGNLFAQSNDMEEARRIVLGERKDSRSSYPNNDAKDVVLGRDDRRVYDERNSRYPNRYPTTSRSRTEQVNREYDAKIRSIRSNRTLSASEKERIIRDLNYERERKIRNINGDRRYDNRRYDDDNKYKKNKKNKNKGNNGNHYGWQKGKGNPHRKY